MDFMLLVQMVSLSKIGIDDIIGLIRQGQADDIIYVIFL